MKALVTVLIALILSVWGFAFWLQKTIPNPATLPPLQNGDIVFQSARSDQSLAILLATHSLYMHTGIVERDPDGKLYVIQAAQTVVETPLPDYIWQSYGARLTIMRFAGITPAQAAAVVAAARKLLGRPYDFFFRLDPSQIYCSELVYDAFLDGAGIALGHLQPIGTLSINNFAVRKIIATRWQMDPGCQARHAPNFAACYAIILHRQIITPVSLSRDPRLQTLYDNY